MGRRREARHLTGPGPGVAPLDALVDPAKRAAASAPVAVSESPPLGSPTERLDERRRRWFELRRRLEAASAQKPL